MEADKTVLDRAAVIEVSFPLFGLGKKLISDRYRMPFISLRNRFQSFRNRNWNFINVA
jgi:hypothetical protein